MSIQSNLNEIKSSLPAHLMEAYNAGQRIFGENKIQEMAVKYEEMPKDIEWHMIGHVQTNKVKYMASFVSLVHGVDSLKLLAEINKQAKKHNRIINCLLQMHIAEEETKFGMDEQELQELLSSDEFRQMENIKVTGLMGMATFTDDENQIRKEFTHLSTIFNSLSKQPETRNLKPGTLSMGMSGDYNLAIECGSTMVRIGSSIFGHR